MTVWLHTPFRLFTPVVIYFAHLRFLGGKDSALCYERYGRIVSVCTAETMIAKKAR